MKYRAISRFALAVAAAALWSASGLLAQSPISLATSTPVGTIGVSYNGTITATGGTPPYSFSATTNLPPGLRITTSGPIATISGTPTTGGIYNFTVSVTDAANANASKALSIVILAPFSITTSSPLPAAIVGQAYSTTLASTGGTSPFQWNVGTGFPAGLSLNTTSGVISGTPTTAGNYSFVISVSDSTAKSTSATFGLSVTPGASSLAITTQPPLFNGQTGAAYSQVFLASGGTLPYTWSVLSGDTGGLTLNSSSGLLSGTPQSAGQFTFTIQVKDNAGAIATAAFTITVAPPALTMTAGSPLPAGTVGVAYDQKFQVAASGGTPPYTWAMTSAAVPGLVFNAATVELAGTPTAAGNYSLTLQVSDSVGAKASRNFPLTISAGSLSITSARQLTAATINVAYSQTLQASGGAPPYTWTANGLPTGLKIDGTTGEISGTPTAAGAFTAVITVTDSSLIFVRDNFTLQVQLPSIPQLTISGLSSTSGAAQQFPLSVSLASPFPAALQGRLTVSFQPSSGLGDSTIQFSTGGTGVNFTIPTGSTKATFLDSNGLPVSGLQMQTGTAAGSITVSLSSLTAGGTDVTPIPAPSSSTQVAVAAPVITAVSVIRNADSVTGCAQGQVCIEVSGYTTAREVTGATFTFSAVSGQTLQSTAGSISVDVTSLFSGWFRTSAMGGQFVFVQPFTISGSPSNVIPLTVTLTNRTGTTSFNIPQ